MVIGDLSSEAAAVAADDAAAGLLLSSNEFSKQYPLHHAVMEIGTVEAVSNIITNSPHLLDSLTSPLQRTALIEAVRLNHYEVGR